MDRAAKRADRIIAVLSPTFLQSAFTAQEWAAAFAADPMGSQRTLVPVRVRECDPERLLGQVVYIDLVGLDADAATAALLAGVDPGRAKPLTKPEFPGSAAPARLPGETPPAAELHWRVLPVVRRESRYGQDYGPAMLEVHVLSVEPVRVEVRRLRDLLDELVPVGRRLGLFSQSERIETDTNAERTLASAAHLLRV